MRPFQVTVLTDEGSSTFIALATSGCAATADAMQHFPQARRISAKPVKTRILG